MSFVGDVRFCIRRGKPCPCDWCGETIIQGVKYASYGQKWDGEFDHMKMHEECHRDGYSAMDWLECDWQFAIKEMVRGEPVFSEGYGY